jgi:hypothetical protein
MCGIRNREGWFSEWWREELLSGDRTSYLGGVDIRVVGERYVNEGRDKGYRGPTLISSRDSNVSVCGGG